MNGAVDECDVAATAPPGGRGWGAARVVAVWVGRREAHLTVDGPGDAELVIRLDSVLERLLDAGARHLVVDLHRLVGDDHDVLELLAATCYRVWDRRGVVEIGGLRDRLATSPSVTAFPEVFGIVERR